MTYRTLAEKTADRLRLLDLARKKLAELRENGEDVRVKIPLEERSRAQLSRFLCYYANKSRPRAPEPVETTPPPVMGPE